MMELQHWGRTKGGAAGEFQAVVPFRAGDDQWIIGFLEGDARFALGAVRIDEKQQTASEPRLPR